MGAQTALPTQPATTNRSIMTNPHLPIRVFLLSDHRLLRGALARALRSRADISLVSAQESSLNITADIVESTCDVLLVGPLNTRAFDNQVFDQLQNAISNLRIVMIEMEATVADVVSAILSGSQDLGQVEGPVSISISKKVSAP